MSEFRKFPGYFRIFRHCGKFFRKFPGRNPETGIPLNTLTVMCCTKLYLMSMKILFLPWMSQLIRTVLYCTVLYCTVLYCTVLYCTVLCCTVLYCTVPVCKVSMYSLCETIVPCTQQQDVMVPLLETWIIKLGRCRVISMQGRTILFPQGGAHILFAGPPGWS